MNWICIATALTIFLLSYAMASDYNTTKDGDFQAIAQGSDRISVYWRHNGSTEDVFANGRLVATVPPDATGPFSCFSADSLDSDTAYVFRLGEQGPSVCERTSAAVPETRRFDLIVIGATASGTAAAISAARLGLAVALVEETNRIGGMSVNGLGSSDIRQQSRANGLFEDFRSGVREFYGEGNGLRYESRVALAVMKRMLYAQPGVQTFLRCRAVEPLMRGSRVEGAIVTDIVSGQSGSLWADTIIDATDTADFATACGCEVRIGRESRSEEEPHAGHILFRNSDQTILTGSTGEGDDKVQSYAYLMIWKDYGEGPAPMITQPRFYDPETYRHSPVWAKTWNATSGKLPNLHYEINQHPFGIDWPGINYDYPTASHERRSEIEAMVRDRALGYLYYFQNELGHTNLGLADDEFLDNDNFPVSLYVREARRVVGEYVLNEADVTNARSLVREDAVLIGDYPMDSHAMEDLKDPSREDKGEGECWLQAFTPWYQVPYGVIVPTGVENLLVTTAVSATHIGYGTLRMEPVRMSMGQAAGVAAYWRKLTGQSLRTIDTRLLQDKLLSAHAYTTWYDDVDRETRHFKAIQYLGTHGFFSGEHFRPDEPTTRGEAADMLARLVFVESGGTLSPTIQPPEPTDAITRGQFAEMLVSAKQMTSSGWETAVVNDPPYPDVARDNPHAGAISVLKSRRITPDLFAETISGQFGPGQTISRADAAEAVFLAHREHAFGAGTIGPATQRAREK